MSIFLTDPLRLITQLKYIDFLLNVLKITEKYCPINSAKPRPAIKNCS